MRARMALKLADIAVEIREISLRDKPVHMLQVSPKGTVPVLILADGSVIDESLEVMIWAFNNAREESDALIANALGHFLSNSFHELDSPCVHAAYKASSQRILTAQSDNEFKKHLDCYKYPERHREKTQQAYRQLGEIFLTQLENLLQHNRYLFGEKPSFADYAIFPFIRQFAAVDSAWFDGSSLEGAPYPKLCTWLNGWVNSALFTSIMQKQPIFIQ